MEVEVSLRERLGWDSFFERQLVDDTHAGLHWARVIEEHPAVNQAAGVGLPSDVVSAEIDRFG